ncbi:MAG TPA: hypothetical protein VGS16_10295 [Candidatus Dormibacteraeota bacterium]|nr:hypothetical protein [Candidatus Dormibacteraeota bacterium]
MSKIGEGSTLAGFGAIAFSVLTVVGVAVGGAPGGNYAASDVASYVAIGHLPTVIVTGYLALFGVLGLICVFAYLRELISVDPAHKMAASVFWGTGLAAAASMAVAWSFITGIAVAAAEGGSSNPGNSVAATVSSAETYTLSDTSINVLYGSGGFMLGFALISLMVASRGTLPGWLRWLSLVIGVLAIAAPAYFPSFAIPIWGLVIGGWLIASGTSGAAVRSRAFDTMP